jgi:hypothetical protein
MDNVSVLVNQQVEQILKAEGRLIRHSLPILRVVTQ